MAGIVALAAVLPFEGQCQRRHNQRDEGRSFIQSDGTHFQELSEHDTETIQRAKKIRTQI